MTWRIRHGDCIAVMGKMAPASVDAIITDPPYGLGFMGQQWDALPPGLPWARECLRVLKPGGHLLAFGGTRTYHRLAVAIEDAGFEMRDCLAWLYGSGFPKSKNLDGVWQDWGTALKPAFEPIVLARKPLTGTVAETVFQHGTGALNVGECRTGPGRWPANVLLDEEAAAMLDEQTGELPSQETRTDSSRGGRKGMFGVASGGARREYLGQSGGASRFLYVAKASTEERNRGTVGNTHPTVKPVELMRWLCRLITPPGGLVLDPFVGSGSTGIAALRESFSFVGIDNEPEYVAIARARIVGDAPLLNGGLEEAA